jgi:hypothetical protein
MLHPAQPIETRCATQVINGSPSTRDELSGKRERAEPDWAGAGTSCRRSWMINLTVAETAAMNPEWRGRSAWSEFAGPSG